jgi:hypothetical protein
MKTNALIAAALVLPALLTQASAQGCGYEANLGTPLGLGDDAVAPGLALGFPFAFPDGTSTTSIDVDSNGRIMLPGLLTSDYTESVAELLSNSSTICPLWTDLNPSDAGADGVYFNALPGKAVVTWKDVPYFGTTTYVTVQCTLWADNRITFVFDSSVPLGSDALVGVSEGNGVADPGAIDYSTRPFPSTTLTVYESFVGTFDLTGEAVDLINVGSGYIVVTPQNCASTAPIGDGCGGDPNPASFYELFDGGALVNDLSNSAGVMGNWTGTTYVVTPSASPFVAPTQAPLSFGDDQTQQITLPWSMPTAAGTIMDVYVCSNGWLSFEPTTSTTLGESDNGLVNAGFTMLAGMWDDLNPSAGGAMYAEVDPTNPSLFHITWDQVPEFGQSTPNTFQISLNQAGGFELKYGVISALDGLAGYSRGNGLGGIPAPTDLTNFTPFAIGDGSPNMSLVGVARPVIGTTAVTETRDIPASAISGFHMYGTTAIPLPGIDLSIVYMPGCRLYVSGDVTVGFVAAGTSTAQHSLAIPNNASLAGAHLYSQSIVVAPGTNTLGIVTSNAVDFLLNVQ